MCCGKPQTFCMRFIGHEAVSVRKDEHKGASETVSVEKFMNFGIVAIFSITLI